MPKRLQAAETNREFPTNIRINYYIIAFFIKIYWRFEFFAKVEEKCVCMILSDIHYN